MTAGARAGTATTGTPAECRGFCAGDAQPAWLTAQLITCIGNKRALLPHIEQQVLAVRARLGGRRLACLDLFSGSGAVARLLKLHAARLLANDLELYSAVGNRCYLANASAVDHGALAEARARVHAQAAGDPRPGFITRLYAPADDDHIRPGERAFYTRRNALYLDTARAAIAREPAHLQPLLLAPLLARASVHANTAGVFKGFYKSRDGTGQFGGQGRDALARITAPISLDLPLFAPVECAVEVTREDANTLVAARAGECWDLAYLDPPYNQHPYGSNYFMLNLLAHGEEPAAISPVSGIPAGWNRSRYNRRRESADALFEVVERLAARFVLLSYNSEGFIPRARFESELARLGRVQVQALPYNAFRGSRNLAARPAHVTEFLYLLEKA